MQLIKAGGLIAVIPYISGTPSAPKEDNSETKHTELLHKLKITWPEFFQSNGMELCILGRTFYSRFWHTKTRTP